MIAVTGERTSVTGPRSCGPQPTLALLLGYLLGSIPFGVILTRLAGAGDLRAIGSGNIGATNVLRTGRKELGGGDAGARHALKGLVGGAGWSRSVCGRATTGSLAAATAFLGHCYPVWLRFRGGKGVATLMGIVLALYWPIGLVYALMWLGLLALLRISSLAGMAAAVSTPLWAALLGAVRSRAASARARADRGVETRREPRTIARGYRAAHRSEGWLTPRSRGFA